MVWKESSSLEMEVAVVAYHHRRYNVNGWSGSGGRARVIRAETRHHCGHSHESCVSWSLRSWCC